MTHSIATRLPTKTATTAVSLAKSLKSQGAIPRKLYREINKHFGRSNKQKLRDVARGKK